MSSLRDLTVSIAREAAELAVRRRREGVHVAASKSSITDVVTEADREVERLVVERILAARPDDGVVGEEGSRIEGTSGLTWVVDPIDGTVNYLYDIPGHAVSIAVVEGEPTPATWVALAGTVVESEGMHVHTAARGEGATRDGVALRVGEAAPLEQMLVGTGFSYDAARRQAQGAVVAGLLGRVRDLRRIGSAAMDIVYAATGTFDAYYERGLKPWDMAAASLIALEAGASVRRLGEPDEPMFLAVGPAASLDVLMPVLLELGAHRA